MHTPVGTLERDSQPPTTEYSTVVQVVHTQPSVGAEIVSGYVVSLPNQDDRSKFTTSVLHLQNELGNLNLQKSTSEPNVMAPQIGQDSSPDTPLPPYDLNKGWITGIFGCLRPVLAIIGKGAGNPMGINQDDWEIAFEQITDLHFLGGGSQGVVFSGMLNNQPVAVKKVRDIKETDIRNLRKLDHPNIVKFKGVCTQQPCFSIIMEFCPYGPLFDLLRNQKNVVTTSRVVTWAKQITSGMHYLHSQKIIHRDLKSPNVLIGEGEIIKISDFGTSKTWNGVSEKMSFAGTIAWMAPEAIRELECSEKVDVWSFGVVLWELLTCQIPYDGMEQNAIMFLVGCGRLKPPIPKTCPEGFKLIMEMCWKFNPKERPSFKLILNHLQIAAVEILALGNDTQFFKTQESWKEEIQSKITQYKAQFNKHRIEMQLKEEQMLKKREDELKHINDIKELLVRKIDQVDQLYFEAVQVVDFFNQRMCSNCNKRCTPNKRNRFGFMKKINQRRTNTQNSTTTESPTSPDCQQQQNFSNKAPLYAQLSRRTEAVTQTTQTSTGSNNTGRLRTKKHYRSNSGSPRNSKVTICRNSVGIDAETQTDLMDFSDETTDLSPCDSILPIGNKKVPQQRRAILHEIKNESDNGNSIQLQYLNPDPVVEVFKRSNSIDQDAINSNDDVVIKKDFNDDDALETIAKKFSALKNGNILSEIYVCRSENGNLTSEDDIIKRTMDRDSTEDGCNDSYTDEEGEAYGSTLRRRSNPGKDIVKSLARRPIYPGRRSSRYKYGFGHHHHHHHRDDPEVHASDEGNTSEYSISPSSKNSTLESNPDKSKFLCNPSVKRSNKSDDTDSDSDEDDENNSTTTYVNNQQVHVEVMMNDGV